MLTAPGQTCAWTLPRLVDARNKIVGEMIGPDMVLLKMESKWFGLPVDTEGFVATDSLKLLYELPNCWGAPYIRSLAQNALMVRADGDNASVTDMGILYYPDESDRKQITVLSTVLMNHPGSTCESAEYQETVSRIRHIHLNTTGFSRPFRIK